MRYCPDVSAILPHVRFVRQFDLSPWGEVDRLRVNPRTHFAEGRAGISWTGVRKYRTPSGLLRVLRRPEQVLAPAHLATLRRLPTCAGHPSEDRDVLPRYPELRAGSTGDTIDVEKVGPWPRPVADFTVDRPEVFAEMMTPSQWAKYCRDYPDDCKGVKRASGPAKTGTSLGYNALWVSPTRVDEIVKDNEGALVGEWKGPDDKLYEYDVEHYVDPECELVLKLKRDEDFDPATLGGQHFAVKLAAFTGRGGDQAELLPLKVVRDQIICDPTGRSVTFQVPRATSTSDVRWVVSANRDLPLEEGERAWDGDAAKASIFDGAGWPNSPDPSKAGEGFLVYDADAGEEKGAYKFPIARRGEDGRLRVPKSAVDAAASALPKAKGIPPETIDRMRGVIEHYQERFEARAAKSRDAQENTVTVTKQNVFIGVRDSGVKTFLSKRGLGLASTQVALDMMDASKVEEALTEIMGRMSSLVEMLKGAEGERDMYKEQADAAKMEAEDMAKKMADMPSAEEAKAKVEELEKQLADAKAMAEKAGKEAADAQKTADAAEAQLAAAVKQRDAYELELKPVREAQLKAAREDFTKRGLAAKVADACESEADLRRAFVVANVGERFGETHEVDRDGVKVREYVISDERVSDSYDAYVAAVGKAPAKGGEYVPGKGLASLGAPRTVPPVARANDSGDGSAQVSDDSMSTGASIAASCG